MHHQLCTHIHKHGTYTIYVYRTYACTHVCVQSARSLSFLSRVVRWQCQRNRQLACAKAKVFAQISLYAVRDSSSSSDPGNSTNQAAQTQPRSGTLATTNPPLPHCLGKPLPALNFLAATFIAFHLQFVTPTSTPDHWQRPHFFKPPTLFILLPSFRVSLVHPLRSTSLGLNYISTPLPQSLSLHPLCCGHNDFCLHFPQCKFIVLRFQFNI